MAKAYRLLLAGNPNVGKTTLYNYLTHSDNHTGNWHGVTVECASKTILYKDKSIELVDLPGIYSLTVDAGEEIVSRDTILKQDYDCIIYISEVNNLPRNMYLLMQLLELNIPVICVVNMVDELKKLGKTIDYKCLEQCLGIPVVPIAKNRRNDYLGLLDKAIEYFSILPKSTHALDYLNGLPLKKVAETLGNAPEKAGLDKRFCAIKLCENDRNIISKLDLNAAQKAVINKYAVNEEELCSLRYAKIDSIILASVSSNKSNYSHGTSRLDKIFLNRFLALPLFLAIMCAIFLITFGTLGTLITGYLDFLITDLLAGVVKKGLDGINVSAWLTALVIEGVIGGAGGIITFFPQILLLFLFLAFLEDSGYISRVAFMTDGIFRRLGLSGKSSFTLLMGFGCSATAVITSKNLDDSKIKLKTVLLTPYMSCSARLPVYAVLGGLFFSGAQALLIFGLYLTGITAALLTAFIFNKTDKLKTVNTSFVMEMPPYRIPSLKRVLKLIWTNIKAFLIRIGTLIFAVNIIVWLLSNFSLTGGFTQSGQDSILAMLASVIAVIFIPLGFGNWKAAVAILSGLIAKEAVVGTLESFGDIRAIFNYSTPAAFSFLVFVLLYVPCVAAIGAISKEAGKKWAVFSFCLHMAIAYSFSFVSYWTAVFLTAAPLRIILGAVAVFVAAVSGLIFFCKTLAKRKYSM